MSTLSDLLPAGAGGKNVSFIAEGTLSNGQAVALRSDGKVEAVAQASQAIGSANSWAPAGSHPTLSTGPYGSVYDPDQQRVVVTYYDQNNNYYGYCIVGEVDPSNNTITFGTETIFSSVFVITHSIDYDTTNDKVVVFYQDVSSSSHGKARVGTVSGSSISFPGNITTFNNASTEDCTSVFNPDQGVFLVAFKNNGNNGRPTGVVGTVSGNNISFGSTQQADSVTASYLALTYNTTTSRYLFIYNDNQFTNVTCQLPTTSGSTVTFGGAVGYVPLNGSNTAQGNFTNLVSDDASNTAFIVTANTQNNTYISAIAITIPALGNTLTFGTENFFAGNTVPTTISAVFDKGARKLVVSYVSNNNATVVAASFVGTTLTFGSPNTWRTLPTNYLTNVYDDSHDRVVISYYEPNTSSSASVVFKPESSNVTRFIGITDAAIANASTGNVTIKGGIASKGLSGLTPNSVYYVADNGTISTTSTGLRIGKALSTSSINLEFQT